MKRIAWVILLIVVLLAAVLVIVRFTHPKDSNGTQTGDEAAEAVTPQKDTEQETSEETAGSQQAEGNTSDDSQSEAGKTTEGVDEQPEADTPTEIPVTDEFVIEVDETENVDGF